MDTPFAVKTEVTGGCLVLTTTGYINNTGGEAIAREFAPHFTAGIRSVIINLGGSKVVNSIGMSFLIEIIDQLNDAGGKVVFTDMDPAVEKMLSIMGLFQFAGKAKSVDEALASLA